LFSIGRPAHFEPDGFAQQRLERREVPVRGPDFEFRVAGRSQLQQEVLAAVAELEA
jgi:hypothetical protein